MIAGIIKQVWRNLLFVLVGNEKYYPASRWDAIYKNGYHLDVNDQAARYGALLGIMERYDRGSPVLDLGCGEGLLEQKFRRLSDTAMLGVDYSEEAIRSAKAKMVSGCDFICANYRELKFAQPFSLIVLNESLYYIDDVRETLDELSRYLVTDGVFIISMFDAFSTRRIWSALRVGYVTVHAIVVKDDTHGKIWQIRVLRPARTAKAECVEVPEKK